jgi:transcriptional regulator with XRE-family HTH domain
MSLGLTQAQFAGLIGVAYQQVHRYELGINRISAGQLYLIACGTGTPIEYFFEGLEMPPPYQSMLLDLMRSLGEIENEEYLGVISQIVRSLAG